MLQEFAHLRKQFWGRQLWARGYLAVSSGNITDELIPKYIEEQEGQPMIDESRFTIDSWLTPRRKVRVVLSFVDVFVLPIPPGMKE